ncbi:MAG: rhodanese-like domain-containing protein [Bacteroidales bacterium]|nr:rhodanese-like domain-containing protein [Bacteroidales bacterium]
MIRFVNLLAFVVTFVSGLSFFLTRESKYKSVSCREFAAIIRRPDMQLLDCRTDSEYVAGHIAGSILIDVRQPDFVERVDSLLCVEHPVAVYCRGGVRSRRAADTLTQKGFVVFNLDKGIERWIEEGREIVTD